MSMRVMWLLNHSAARKFEIPMLKKIGIEKIFMPKKFPADVNFRSANVDFSEDENLDIPAAELQILNAADWYGGADAEAWRVANKYFDLIFIILHQAGLLANAARHFNGVVLLRAYGLVNSISYDHIAKLLNESHCVDAIGGRFYFGEAYSHLADAEPEYLKKRRIFLPLGIGGDYGTKIWEGAEKQIYFVCPDIGINNYYKKIHEKFCKSFSGIEYKIAGAQPIQLNDPHVLGYVSNERHAHYMTQSRVMFYHSQEPNHIHYHPFEAIRSGMPLVFMAGGMLDRMGGKSLPGRCLTLTEARYKIERILADDWRLIDSIRSSQAVLLEAMKPENCEQAWRAGFARIEAEAKAWRAEQAVRPRWISKRKRVAVVLPVGYRGGSLRAAFELVKALDLGSRKAGDEAEIVFMHLDDPDLYQDEDFLDLPETIARRPFRWKILTVPEARRAMHYAGFRDWVPKADSYMIPDDGIQQLADCDVCLIVSDRLFHPILPLKPVVLMVYDYIQRYVPQVISGGDRSFLTSARSADRVFVTTEFTRQDALQYAGVESSRLRKVPMLIPNFQMLRDSSNFRDLNTKYFLWTTNAAPHKNHRNAAKALEIYYEELDGCLDCNVTGANTQGMLHGEFPHLKDLSEVFKRSPTLRKRVNWLGELPDSRYKKVLAGAKFLWHAGCIDNGTFSVIEAACVGVPALSSDYPAMREINSQFKLNMLWMDQASPKDMAMRLKDMEQEASAIQAMLPSESQLRSHDVEHHAEAYWRELCEII